MKKIILFVIGVALLWAAAFFVEPNFFSLEETRESNYSPKYHYAYYMQRDFYSGIISPDKIDPLNKQISGGIVAHHFYAERQIAIFFRVFKGQHPQTVVILGPNHFNRGNFDLVVSQCPYQTPWGVLEPDQEIIQKLLERKIVKLEEKVFEQEHSISNLVGFVKYQFPEAKIVPIITKRNSRLEDLEALANYFHEILPSNSLVLASVDFSHHVDNKTAQKQDQASIEILKAFDYLNLLRRTPRELDSPAVVFVLLRYLEMYGAKRMTYINTNQALLSGNLASQDVTSYIFAHFYK